MREEGPRIFYRGFGATLVRAVPQTGMTMAAYNVASERLVN